MKKHFLFWLILTVVLLSCKKEPDPGVITMTTSFTVMQTKGIAMAGTGSVTIDWGDGTGIETHALEPYKYPDWQNRNVQYRYLHSYLSGTHSIKIEGKNITHLRCNSTRLVSLDVSRNTALQWLSCNDNQLTVLGVNNNTALTYLECDRNRLEKFFVSNSLTELIIYDNQLTDLDISGASGMTYLDCSSNQLIILDLTKNAALKNLYCNGNQLTALNVSNNTALDVLWCHDNQLKSLDVSNNLVLGTLRCHNNQLTNLKFGNNLQLTNVHCYENQLEALDMTPLISLRNLYCQSNHLSDEALIAMFETLHDKNAHLGKKVYIEGNPGAGSFVNGAEIKGWKIYTE